MGSRRCGTLARPSADWRVAIFSVLLALAVTFLFGLAPALRASSVKPVGALKGANFQTCLSEFDAHQRARPAEADDDYVDFVIGNICHKNLIL